MKKTTRVRRPRAQSTEGRAAVDAYIARAVGPGRTLVQNMRSAIRSTLPRDAVETISYKIPAFKRGRVLVWYAVFEDHCSLFPTAATIEACKKDLEGFTTSKGTVQFPIDEALPIGLIKKLVRTRVAQVEGRARITKKDRQEER